MRFPLSECRDLFWTQVHRFFCGMKSERFASCVLFRAANGPSSDAHGRPRTREKSDLAGEFLVQVTPWESSFASSKYLSHIRWMHRCGSKEHINIGPMARPSPTKPRVNLNGGTERSSGHFRSPGPPSRPVFTRWRSTEKRIRTVERDRETMEKHDAIIIVFLCCLQVTKTQVDDTRNPSDPAG